MKMRLATRGSRLALAQTQIVVDLLRKASPGIEVQIIPIKTLGDVLPPDELGRLDAKSAFTFTMSDTASKTYLSSAWTRSIAR